MSTEIVKTDLQQELIEKVVVSGDLEQLPASLRVEYYKCVCDSLGLNPYTKPFEYIKLNGKMLLYATRACTEQLRKIHGISIEITAREKVGDVYIVTAKAMDRAGRFDESVGAVNLANLKGDALGNAIMKAETKAKRRVTLSIAGLGWLDECEVETIAGAKKVEVNDNGEVIEYISEDERKELFAAADRNAELVMHMIKKYGYLRTDEILKADYDNIINDIKQHIADAELSEGESENDG